MDLPRNQWPTSQDITGVQVPEEELMKLVNVAHISTQSPLIDIERLKSRSYTLVMRVVAIVLKMAKKRSFKIDDLTSEDIKTAEGFCLKLSMKYTNEDLQKGKLTSRKKRRWYC